MAAFGLTRETGGLAISWGGGRVGQVRTRRPGSGTAKEQKARTPAAALAELSQNTQVAHFAN
jgi:hypothetical protein